jgi:FtsZ-binding cell division protein ZapB
MEQAQQAADRIRLLRQELETEELKEVLALTPEQKGRFDDWSRMRLAELARQFDVDTSASQKRVSWACGLHRR